MNANLLSLAQTALGDGFSRQAAEFLAGADAEARHVEIGRQ